MITPVSSSVNEYVPFSVTYTVSAPEPIPGDPNPVIPPILESVSVTASDGNDYSSELTITIHGDTSFTVEGLLADVFNREMHYLDKDDNFGLVRRFKDIPADFNTLYHYKGATVNSVDITVSAITDQGTETATIIVQNNYNVANAYLVNYVALGKY